MRAISNDRPRLVIVIAFLAVSAIAAWACKSAPGPGPSAAAGPTATAGPGATATPTVAAPACAADAAVPDALTVAGSVILIGEIHGIEETPAFTGDVACHAARTGRPVHVGLEIPGSEQSRLDAYLASPGADGDRRALLASEFWTRDYQDGRSSHAMLTLLETLRALRSAGRDVRVFAFDIEMAEVQKIGGKGRDLAMAARILERVAKNPDHLFVILTGNIHARTRPGTPWDATFEPMGMHIARDHDTLTALNCVYPGGTAWACQSAKVEDCGMMKIGGKPSDRRGIEILAEPTEEGYHGLCHLPGANASLPALYKE